MKPPVTPATVFLSSSEYQCQADPNRAFFAKHSFPKIFSGPQPHVDSQMLPRNVYVPLVSFLPVSRFCTLPLQAPPDSPVFTTSCPVDQAKAVKEELPERLLWAVCSPHCCVPASSPPTSVKSGFPPFQLHPCTSG